MAGSWATTERTLCPAPTCTHNPLRIQPFKQNKRTNNSARTHTPKRLKGKYGPVHACGWGWWTSTCSGNIWLHTVVMLNCMFPYGSVYVVSSMWYHTIQVRVSLERPVKANQLSFLPPGCTVVFRPMPSENGAACVVCGLPIQMGSMAAREQAPVHMWWRPSFFLPFPCSC